MPSARWLCDIVQQSCGEQDLPFQLRQSAKLFKTGQKRRNHSHVSPNCPFGMKQSVLRTLAHSANPFEFFRQGRPVDIPARCRRAAEWKRVHAKRSTPSRRRFGSIGRSAQWDSESATVCRNPERTNLQRAVTRPSSSLLMYNPSSSSVEEKRERPI